MAITGIELPVGGYGGWINCIPSAPFRGEEKHLRIARTIEIIDSQGLVDCSVRFSLPVIPSRVTLSAGEREPD